MSRRPKKTVLQRKHTDGQQTHETMLNSTHYQRNTNQNCNDGKVITKKSTNLNTGEDVEKREPSYIVGKNVNCYNHYREQYGSLLKNLKIKLPYDSAMLLLGMHRDKTITQKHTRASVSTAALFTTARMQRQARHPATGERTKVCICNGMLRLLKSPQACPSLCEPLDYSPPGSSIHGILQARVLEWVVMPSSRGSS